MINMVHKYFFKEDTGWLKEKRLFLFFDFDGTLVPIQNDPSSCWLDSNIKQYIKKILNQNLAHVAVLSGRSLVDLKKRINIKDIYYGGNHGLELEGPDLKFIHPEVKPLLKTIKNTREIIQKSIYSLPGVFVEDKKLSFTLHFRMADKIGKSTAKSIFKKIILKDLYNMPLKVLKGKMVLEVAPRIDWDKGRAVLYILDKFKNKFIPIFIGDDITDETAFSALKGKGITIRVGRSTKTNAKYYIRSQKEIDKFFKNIML